jgi:hypothetical protein
MPKIFPFRVPPDPVLNVVLAFGARLVPRSLCWFAVVRMDSVEPTEPEALVKAKARKFYPLWARPSPATIGPRQEDKLRNASGQKAKALFAIVQALRRLTLLSSIARYLTYPPSALRGIRRPEAQNREPSFR